MNIQWYPGHMTKTRRQMAEYIKQVDMVCEILDARIPYSSRNPDLDNMVKDMPRMVLLNRIDLAREEETRKWAVYFQNKGYAVLRTDCKSGKGTKEFSAAIKRVLEEKIRLWHEKGQTGRVPKVMVVGIPNVGKSTFINRVIGKRSAKASDRPGVTRGAQWFRLEGGVALLDTPGVLWPKFEEEIVGVHLAVTGAIKDDILDTETLGCKLLEILAKAAPLAIESRYKLAVAGDIWEYDFPGYELLQRLGKKRGFLISGGEVDTERMAKILLDEFRGGILGNITLETVEEYGDELA